MPRGLPDSFAATAALRLARRLNRRGRGGGRSKLVIISFQGLVLYKPVLNYELNATGGMVGRHMLKIGGKILVGARRKVGVSSGALRDSIHIEHKSLGKSQYIKVGSSLHYALMHHEGTKPHIIAAKPPGVLRFRSRGGAVVHTAAVMHPGTKPNRYLSSQLRKFIR
tara:strand:- start:10914 stop:11414 length:501 start_codon:yes stop_codon:yes gene_type:complete